MSLSPRRRKRSIKVLVIAPDRMTAEVLTNACGRGAGNLAVTTLVGASHADINQLPLQKPDVALIADEFEEGSQVGFEILRKLRASHRNTAAIMLLKSSSADAVIDTFREGARGVFYRDASLKTLSKCIRVVHGGQLWVGNRDVEHLISALRHTNPMRVTRATGLRPISVREKEVVQLVADGMSNRAIAKSLDLTEDTVRNRLYRIFGKLGISTRVELILYLSSQRDATN